jgi:hypothetical protein
MLARLIDGPKDFLRGYQVQVPFVLIHLTLFIHGWIDAKFISRPTPNLVP